MSTVLDNGITVVWDLPQDKRVIYIDRIPPLKEKPGYTFVKRVFDLVFSILALIVLLIPMVFISLLILLDSPGNPIYSQVRLGKDEKPFKLYKFRSMRIDAEEDGLRWAEEGDPRITKIGYFLRRSRIDELPQLVNILLGQMSFVGPRPERPEFYAVFDQYIDGFRQRMLVKPGLTGVAQVNGGYYLKPEEKIVYDLDYITHRSVMLDLRCILKTFSIIGLQEGAY